MHIDFIRKAFKAGIPCQQRRISDWDWVDLDPAINFHFEDHTTEYRINPDVRPNAVSHHRQELYRDMPTDSPKLIVVGKAAYMPGTTGFTMVVFKAEDVPVDTQVYTFPKV